MHLVYGYGHLATHLGTWWLIWPAINSVLSLNKTYYWLWVAHVTLQNLSLTSLQHCGNPVWLYGPTNCPGSAKPLSPVFQTPWTPNILLQVAVSEVLGHAHFDGLVQDCSNSSALTMELLQSCTKPSICTATLSVYTRVAVYQYWIE